MSSDSGANETNGKAPVEHVGTWDGFDRHIRQQQRSLLAALDKFNDPILVAGCQRSGTTAVATLLKQATVLEYLDVTGDSELDDALILADGLEWHESGRPCFQTTYLNEQFDEYWQHQNYTLIWVLREPVSVVHSMLGNWSADALERLYRGVGKRFHEDVKTGPGLRTWLPGAQALIRACASYLGKLDQLEVLVKTLPTGRLIVIDYVDLMSNTSPLIKLLCQRLSLNYKQSLDELIGFRTRPRRPRILLQDIDSFANYHCASQYRQSAQHALKVGLA